MRREDLPRLNQLNEDRDAGAKRIAQAAANSSPNTTFHANFLFGFAPITHNGTRIVSTAETSLITSLSLTPLQLYWLDKCSISPIHRSVINWSSFRMASGRLPLHRHHFLINWISRMTVVGSIARTRKIGHQYRCPRCDAWNETHSHVVTCIQPKARRLRTTLLEGLKAWFTTNDTHPEIASSLYRILSDWSRHPSSFRLPFLYLSNNALLQTIQLQNEIGWYNMLLGMQVNGWAEIQQQHYQNIPDCHKSGAVWASKLQFELWGIIWDMWQHRQEVRRETPTAEDIVLQQEARVAAIRELHTGIASLPQFYTIYFTMTQAKLLEKSAVDLRVWLRLIRSARESMHIFASDLFSENGPHRSWLGLRRRTSFPSSPPTLNPATTADNHQFDHEVAAMGGISI